MWGTHTTHYKGTQEDREEWKVGERRIRCNSNNTGQLIIDVGMKGRCVGKSVGHVWIDLIKVQGNLRKVDMDRKFRVGD
jgi:hypothetical protein